jgi:phosphoglycolate phosphatase
VITDIDNTLYDFVSYFGPAFRAMVHALAARVSLDEDDLVEQFRRVYERHGSLEYNFSIQELELSAELNESETADLIRTGRGAFLSVRRRRLHPYPQAEATLRELQDEGYNIVAVTSASLYNAQLRLYELGLDRYLDGLVAWEGFDAESGVGPAGGFVRTGRSRKRSRISDARLATVQNQAMKPSTRSYEIALEWFPFPVDRVWVLGDSALSDLVPAIRLGMHTVWAKYGTLLDHRDLETLKRIVPWSPKKMQLHMSAPELQPEISLDRLSELPEHLPRIQQRLF